MWLTEQMIGGVAVIVAGMPNRTTTSTATRRWDNNPMLSFYSKKEGQDRNLVPQEPPMNDIMPLNV